MGGDENEEVLIGEEEDENSPPDANMSDILVGLKLIEAEMSGSSPSSIPLLDPPFLNGREEAQKETQHGGLFGIRESNVQMDTTRLNMTMRDMTGDVEPLPFPSTTPAGSGMGPVGSTEILQTEETESSLGVPLYHVEHLEPPAQPKWRPPPPDEIPSTTQREREGLSTSTSTQEPSTQGNLGIGLVGSSTTPTEPGVGSTQGPPTTPDNRQTTETTGGGNAHEEESLRREMETLLEGVHETYASLLGIVSAYEENNMGNPDPPRLIHPSDFSSERESIYA